MGALHRLAQNSIARLIWIQKRETLIQELDRSGASSTSSTPLQGKIAYLLLCGELRVVQGAQVRFPSPCSIIF
jgi:hypothetical protein